MEELSMKYSRRMSETIAELGKRGMFEHTAGHFHTEVTRIGIDHIQELTDARVDSLLAAYDRAELPIEDQAVTDINRVAVEYCEAQGKYLVAGAQERAGRSGAPPGVAQQLAATIASAMSGIEARVNRRLSALRDEQILAARAASRREGAGPRPEVSTPRNETATNDSRNGEPGAPAVKRWDIFISHASEDKEQIAHPLADALAKRGFAVWYDKFTLKLGDSLRASIDRGLADSRFGVVILSKHFFAKHWPNQELNGLVAIEVGGKRVILPVWHRVTHADVVTYSPTLADRLAINTEEGVERVVAAIADVVGPSMAAQPAAPRAPENSRTPGNKGEAAFSKIERLMPDLLAEMRKDLAHFPLCREFVALRKALVFNYPERTLFTYYFEDHKDLDGKLRILENLRLIRDVRHNDVPRFVIEEELADYLME
jgi:hypothetical protein